MPETAEHFRPYLAMAVFCEKVLQEKDGVLSAIRIIDRINVSGTDKEMRQTAISPTLVLVFKSGFFRGKLGIKVAPKTPSGKSLPELEFPALFEGEDRGVGIIANMGVIAEEEGLYWFDVLLQDDLITRIPLRILYHRIVMGSPGSP